MTSKAIARIVPIYDLNDTCEPFYAATLNHIDEHEFNGIEVDGTSYSCLKKWWKVEMLWNGEGLPPVGTECDVITKHDITVRATILFVGDDLVVVKSSNGEQYVHIKEVKFRPIRSARDKAVEALCHTITGNHDKWDVYMRHAANIYDAIVAGEIPGVKLED